MLLSPHFSYAEMTRSELAPRLGISNTPSPDQLATMRKFCTWMMEPIRSRFGATHVTSGFRSVALNAAVRGEPTSAHCSSKPGQMACDHFTGDGDFVDLLDEMEWVRSSPLPFDEVIYEFGKWIHVASAPSDRKPKREVLMTFRRHDGKKLYLPWDPDALDPATGLLRK